MNSASPDSSSVSREIAASSLAAAEASLTLVDWQRQIQQMFGRKDADRGVEGTFMWFMEEVGELATALREGPRDNLELEFADVLAWLATLANVAGVDLSAACRRKYGSGCPNCAAIPCACAGEKP